MGFDSLFDGSDAHLMDEGVVRKMTEQNKLSDRLRAGSECAPWVIEEVKQLEAVLTEQNKQPPAEAGEGAVAWMRRDGNEVITNAAYVKVNDVFKCLYFPLYTSQATATQAAVAAAMRKCAEICEKTETDMDEQATSISDFTYKDALEEVRARITLLTQP